MTSNIKYWVWFSSLVRISIRRRLQLLEYFGDPALIWECSESELKALHFCSPKVIDALTDKETRGELPGLLDKINRCDADIITIKDSMYPEELKSIPDPPIVLYCLGKLEKAAVCVAVVGSRRATYYGLEMAGRISQKLAENGVTVVSGMARGIDSRAHGGALEGGGRTIAVLGCGIDITYPSENGELRKKIYQSGAVLSEYVPGTPPLAYNFPARNRIISGLSQGVVIIEANERSGSLITADYALEQGKDVFAVPGNINCKNSSGTNKLIKDGAIVVTSVDDILDELKISYGTNTSLYNDKKINASTLGSNEKSIAKVLESGPAHVDRIARDCGISVQLAGSVLVMLELSGFVEQLPGKIYRLTGESS